MKQKLLKLDVSILTRFRVFLNNVSSKNLSLIYSSSVKWFSVCDSGAIEKQNTKYRRSLQKNGKEVYVL